MSLSEHYDDTHTDVTTEDQLARLCRRQIALIDKLRAERDALLEQVRELKGRL